MMPTPGSHNGANDPWLIRPVSRASAEVRLVCFPNAGAGASAFARWHLLLPPSVELWVVQLPGRENRHREPFLTDLRTISDAITSSIVPLADRPLALFGHSMGAVTAFETAKRLRARGVRLSALFLSGRGAPHWPNPSEDLDQLSDDDFIAAVDHRYGGVPALLKEDVEFRQLYLPVLRADIAAVSHHRDTEAPPFECPVHVLGGTGDVTAPREALEGWRRHGVGEFKVHLFPGGHFFVQTATGAVLELLAAELARAARRETANQ